jgi:hypothetical protein
MKSIIVASLLALGFLAGTAQAAEQTPQQKKMAACAHEGKGKKGAEYKAFMKECLSAKKGPAAAAAAEPAKKEAAVATKAQTQQEKMKTCNAEAKGKTGDARKAFMKECLAK